MTTFFFRFAGRLNCDCSRQRAVIRADGEIGSHNKGKQMKTLLAIGITVALCGTAFAQVHTGSPPVTCAFSNDDLKGDYSIKMTFFPFSPSTYAAPPAPVIQSLMYADGNGNVYFTNVFYDFSVGTGTYVVRRDGTGTITSQNNLNGTMYFVLRDGGADGIVELSVGQYSATLTKLPTPRPPAHRPDAQ
jgi:hypothetical protein